MGFDTRERRLKVPRILLASAGTRPSSREFVPLQPAENSSAFATLIRPVALRQSMAISPLVDDQHAVFLRFGRGGGGQHQRHLAPNTKERDIRK
jgi:hypothetical protein